MVNTRPLGFAKGLTRGTVPVDAYGRYRTEGESKTSLPGTPGFGSYGGVRDGQVGLVDCNSYHLCMLQV